jgi:hypothetical protein
MNDLSPNARKVLQIIVANTQIKPGEPDFMDIASGLHELWDIANPPKKD